MHQSLLTSESVTLSQNDYAKPHKTVPSHFSKLFFSWIATLLEFGNFNTIKSENLADFNQQDKAEIIYDKWASNWYFQKQRQHSFSSLKNSIRQTFKWRLIFACLLDFLSISCLIATPVMIYLISNYIMDEQKTLKQGIIWLIIVSIVRFFRNFFQGHAGYRLTVLGLDIGNTMALGMVKKTMKYSVLCNKKFTMGELANLLQVDCFRMSMFPKNFSSVIIILYVLIFSMTYLAIVIGPSFLVGFGVIMVTSLINMLISKKNSVYQKQIADRTDNRMKSTNDVFNNIKFIKVNAWQQYFYDKLEQLRKQQIEQYKKKYRIQTLSTFSMWLAPKMILAAVFGTYVMSDPENNHLDPATAFSVMNLFAYLQFYLQSLPNSLSIVFETLNSIQRIENYLLSEEINTSCIDHKANGMNLNQPAITMKNGNFYWDADKNEIEKNQVNNSASNCYLVDLNFTINKGQIVAVIGDIGAGKSSLLYSLLGQMKYLSHQNPQVTIDGSIGLVTQKPWIINDTVRNNIIFGKRFDKNKYQEVIHYASLKRDFELFTHADDTMIGEKGATLSGGQKARISFARALYGDTDILLLDDLLSAVDVHVGKFMMTETLLKYVKHKTIVLVTHALCYLKYIDKILIMKNGTIVEQGNYDRIKDSYHFLEIHQSMMKQQKRERNGSIDILVEEVEEPNFAIGEVEQQQSEQQSSKSIHSQSNLTHIQQRANKFQSDKMITYQASNQLMMAEQSSDSDPSWGLYRTFAGYNGGTIWILAMFLCMFGWLLFNLSFNIWLSIWTGDESEAKHSNSYYLSYYIFFGCMYGVFSFFRATILAISSPRMSQITHESMISNLLFSPLNQFFDRVPLGRILNRLSKDMNAIDANLAICFSNVLVFSFFMIEHIIIMTITATGWILIPIFVYLIGINFLKVYYMKPNRQLVRLEGITKSPVISCFSEILNGVTTIRAYGVENQFFDRNCNKVNESKSPAVAKKAAESWFVIRITALSFIVNVSALSIVLFTNVTTPSNATLLMVVTLALDQIVFFLMMNLSTFQNELISLERCETFMRLNPQNGYKKYLKNRLVSKIKSRQRRVLSYRSQWPDQGEIRFIDFKVKYRPNLDLVLKGLNVTFEGGSRVGVIGRTGSGKSTVMMSILRILEAYSGKIVIDGKDISQMSLDDLRPKITIILQDPCLFAGTLRENMDPLGQYSDQKINEALEKTALKELMDERKGLMTEIMENGENLSVGERQLISISRAIIKPTKIILIDEATANIDVKTESIIYKAMNQSFKDSTVITIAHRLNTVINSDKILVLEGGLLKQFDRPQNLLKNPNSLFASLYNQSKRQQKI